MSLEDMSRKWVRRVKKRDAAPKKETYAAPSLSRAQRWAVNNPQLAAYDNDGNPVSPSYWEDKRI